MAKRVRRYLRQRWRNGPDDKATARILWWEAEDFAGGVCSSKEIRLEMHDGVTGEKNLFPETRAQAELIFNRFQFLSPKFDWANARGFAVIEQLLDSLQQGGISNG